MSTKVHPSNEILFEKLDNVHTEVVKINGQVKKNTEWRIWSAGALAILTTFAVPIFLMLVSNFISK